MPRLLAVTRARKHADHDQSEHGNWATGGGNLNRLVYTGETIGQWIERRGLEKEGGKIVVYHGTPKGRDWDTLRVGSYLADTAEEARGLATFNKPDNITEKDIEVFRLLISPDDLDPGIHMQLLSEKKLPDEVVPAPTPVKPAKSLKHADHDQSEHGSWADDSGAEKEGRERKDPWEGSLITREKAYEVVNYYTGRGYNDINRHLRGTDRGANDPDIEAKIDAMDAAFFRAPMSREDRTVYRGVSVNVGRELVAGETFKDEGYTSTTTDMRVTEDFTGYGGGPKYVMEITVPSGTRFIEIDESSEKEIILDKGSRFSVEEIREEGDARIIVATLLTGYQGKSKSLKHGDHDQSEHGSWATGDQDKEPKVFPYDPAGEVDDDVDKSDMGTAMEYIPSGPTELVDRWAWNGYANLNQFLRDPAYGEAMLGKDKEAITLMSQDMESLIKDQEPMAQTTTLYRGVDGGQIPIPSVGRVLTDDGFMATSSSEKVALGFAQSNGGLNPVMLAIEAPEGTRALTIDDYSSRSRGEQEVVLQRGTSIEITRVEQVTKDVPSPWETGTVPSKVTVIHAKIVPTPTKSTKHLDGEHDQGDHGSWASGITGGKKLPAAEFAAKLVARAAESRGGKSGVQQLDLSNTSSFAEIKSASDKITSAIDEEMGKWPSAYAEPRVEPTEQQKFLKQFSDGADLMRNTLHSANEGAIGRNKDFQFFVATGVDGTTPVGTLVYRNFTRENVGNNPYLTGHEDKWMELTNIGTNGLEPGVGTRLVTQVLGAAAESGRGVWLNDPYDEAARFYKELGFEMKYKQGDWIGYMEPETVQEWWKSYEAAGGK